MRVYQDRRHAGRVLASALSSYAGRNDLAILALPRGGVPVAFEVARQLAAPLDVLVVRKLGVPGHEELAMGAVASGGVRVVNEEVIQALGLPVEAVEAVARAEEKELTRREALYRGRRPALDVAGRTAILIDDGLATGSSMRAAIESARARRPRAIVVAVPVASATTCGELATVVDDVVCAVTPEPFYAVGLWYIDFAQTTDEEVRTLLERAATDQANRRAQPPEPIASL